MLYSGGRQEASAFPSALAVFRTQGLVSRAFGILLSCPWFPLKLRFPPSASPTERA